MLSTHRYTSLVLTSLILLSAALSLGMVSAPTHQEHIHSIYDLGYLVGPTTHSLLEGRGLLTCSERMGTPKDPICFHSARMPMASTMLAAGVLVFGDRPKQIDFAKTLLFLIPLWLAMAIVLYRRGCTRAAVLARGALLLLPMFVLNLLVVVTSMEVEEGYLYGLIALALVLVLYPLERTLAWTVALAMTLDLIFLSKSSMLPVVTILLLAVLMTLRSWRLRTTAFVLVALAPFCWALYQQHAGGRLSVGTSLDGLNLHKGNNDKFRERYPTSNATFDSYDPELNEGRSFREEWSYNDYHLAAGKQFLLSHPGITALNLIKKASYLLFSLRPYTATRIGQGFRAISVLGILLFRLLLWTAMSLSLYTAFRGRGVSRVQGRLFLAFLAAYCLPYLVGFGFMRHAVVLAYPSAIYCCLGVGRGEEHVRGQGGMMEEPAPSTRA